MWRSQDEHTPMWHPQDEHTPMWRPQDEHIPVWHPQDDYPSGTWVSATTNKTIVLPKVTSSWV